MRVLRVGGLAWPVVLGLVFLAVVIVPAAGDEAATGEAPGGPGPHAFTVEAFTLEVMTGPERDLAVTIDADLWVPASATAATPAPTVLTTHGFGGHKATSEQITNAAYFASHGYVVLSYTSMGFGGSSSCIGLDSLDYDVPVAVAAIDHLAGLPFVATDAAGDPQVGIVGGSYGGGAQGLIGAVDDRVDALAVGRSWHTLQYSLVPNNWIPAGADLWDLAAADQGVFKQAWTSLFFASGSAQPAQGAGGCDPITQQSEFPGQAPCAGFVPEICPVYAQLTATGDTDQAGRDLVARSAVRTVIDRLDVPTLLLQGQPDTLFTPTEAAATYRGLRDRGVPTAMIWHSGGHGGYQTPAGEAEAYSGQWDDTPEAQAEFSRGYLPRRTLQWFDRHVRGRDVDTGPSFAWFRDHVEVDLEASGGSAAPAFGTATDFPVPGAEALAFTLDPAQGTLTADGSTIGGGTAQIFSPAGGEPASFSELPNFSSPGDVGDQPPFDPPGQAVTFRTVPITAPTEIVGAPLLRVHLAHQAPTDLRLFAKLIDVAEDGSQTLIRRFVAPARIPGEAIAAGPVEVRLQAIAWRVEAGHALELVLATTDQAFWNQRVADVVTISSTPDAPSTLTLPALVHRAPVTVDRPPPPVAPLPEPAPSPTPPLPATGGGVGLIAAALSAAAARRRTRTRRARQDQGP